MIAEIVNDLGEVIHVLEDTDMDYLEANFPGYWRCVGNTYPTKKARLLDQQEAHPHHDE